MVPVTNPTFTQTMNKPGTRQVSDIHRRHTTGNRLTAGRPVNYKIQGELTSGRFQSQLRHHLIGQQQFQMGVFIEIQPPAKNFNAHLGPGGHRHRFLNRRFPAAGTSPPRWQKTPPPGTGHGYQWGTPGHDNIWASHQQGRNFRHNILPLFHKPPDIPALPLGAETTAQPPG